MTWNLDPLILIVRREKSLNVGVTLSYLFPKMTTISSF